MAEIGNVTFRVDAVITDEQYHEAMSAVSAANEYIAALEADNARLRVECDEWRRVAKSKQDIIDHMRNANAENAKLRELGGEVASILFNLDVDHCGLCQRDSISHPCPVHTVKGGECLIKSELRELGIEVN